MVREGFSEMLILEQSPKEDEGVSHAEIGGRGWVGNGRKSQGKGHRVAGCPAPSRGVRSVMSERRNEVRERMGSGQHWSRSC